jgi:hypothetical protein
MRQIKEIQDKLNNAEWTAEYCHPHKWLDRDMDNCLYRLEKAHFGLQEVTDAVSRNLDEIIAELHYRENQSFVDVAAEYIADGLACRKLKDKEIFPESAIFSINNH